MTADHQRRYPLGACDLAPIWRTGATLMVVVKDLKKRFGETEALKGVSFEVEPGTVLGVLGPNGAGKTTTVRILTTLLKPDSGTAEIEGIDVIANPAQARARIGLTGQYAAVDERLTGFENLQLIGRFFHMRKSIAEQRAHELLDQFRLDQAADRVVKTYSGGMRRRLDIAMSLIARPSVLFLDEPTTGLDPRSRQEMWEVIENLVAKGTTTLLTTQYLEEAERLADRIVVIDHGTVIAEGTAGELKAQSGGQRVEVTLSDASQLDRVTPALSEFQIDGTHESIDVDALTVTIPVTTTDRLVPAVVRRLDSVGIDVADVVVRRPTLDDVFFELTGKPAEADEDSGDQRGEQ